MTGKQWAREMQEQLNAGEPPLVSHIVCREHKKVFVEVTPAGRRQAEALAQRLVNAYEEKFGAEQKGETRIILTSGPDTVYRWPPQMIKNRHLD
ncbi:MAG: hypothetical protein ACYCW6_09770 [Candidatus Xenobia bacterium]